MAVGRKVSVYLTILNFLLNIKYFVNRYILTNATS